DGTFARRQERAYARGRGADAFQIAAAGRRDSPRIASHGRPIPVGPIFTGRRAAAGARERARQEPSALHSITRFGAPAAAHRSGNGSSQRFDFSGRRAGGGAGGGWETQSFSNRFRGASDHSNQ